MRVTGRFFEEGVRSGLEFCLDEEELDREALELARSVVVKRAHCLGSMHGFCMAIEKSCIPNQTPEVAEMAALLKSRIERFPRENIPYPEDELSFIQKEFSALKRLSGVSVSPDPPQVVSCASPVESMF